MDNVTNNDRPDNAMFVQREPDNVNNDNAADIWTIMASLVGILWHMAPDGRKIMKNGYNGWIMDKKRPMWRKQRNQLINHMWRRVKALKEKIEWILINAWPAKKTDQKWQVNIIGLKPMAKKKKYNEGQRLRNINESVWRWTNNSNDMMKSNEYRRKWKPVVANVLKKW